MHVRNGTCVAKGKGTKGKKAKVGTTAPPLCVFLVHVTACLICCERCGLRTDVYHIRGMQWTWLRSMQVSLQTHAC